jgi:hypothetical protein
MSEPTIYMSATTLWVSHNEFLVHRVTLRKGAIAAFALTNTREDGSHDVLLTHEIKPVKDDADGRVWERRWPTGGDRVERSQIQVAHFAVFESEEYLQEIVRHKQDGSTAIVLRKVYTRATPGGTPGDPVTVLTDI